jgi:hypothetical protein
MKLVNKAALLRINLLNPDLFYTPNQKFAAYVAGTILGVLSGHLSNFCLIEISPARFFCFKRGKYETPAS